MSDSQFFCTKCGNEGIPILRRTGKARKAGHLKKLWCLNCKQEVNHVEVKEFTYYDKSCFDLEFKYGNFDENGNRKMKFEDFKLMKKKEGII